jgi:hypothetical protein
MKNSYILLRNHKESNALSIEELQEIGLKKTDLIWVECQSMAWRSPLEIAELKNLVSASNNDNKKNSTEKLVVKEVSTGEDLLKKPITGKTLPDPDIKNLEKYSHSERTALSGVEKKEIRPQSNKSPLPLDIKEKQLRNPVQKEHRIKSVFAIHLPEHVKKIAFYTGLVLTGALLMILIQNFGSIRSLVLHQKMPPPEKSSASTATIPASLNNNSTPTNFEDAKLLTENSSVTPKKEQKKPVPVTQNIAPKTNAKLDSQDISNNNGEKNPNSVAEINAKPVSIEDISSKIALKANDYKVGLLGGIRNLTMSLQNDSRYMLDKVTVEVKYLNPDGKVISTEQLYFQNVQAGNEASLQVNKSKRGVNVDYMITNIECKALTSHK